MLTEFYRENKAIIKKFAFLIIFILFIYLFITVLFGYVAPFVIGYIFSLIVEPLVRLAEKKLRVRRWISAIFFILVLLASIVSIGSYIVSRTVTEVKGLQENLPYYMEQYAASFDKLAESIKEYAEFIPMEVKNFAESSVDSVTSAVSGFLGTFAKDSSLSLVSSLPLVVMNIILTIISSYFFIKDKKLISDSIGKYSPGWMSRRVDMIRSGFLKAIGSYVKAQAIIMSVTSSIAILGLTIIRSPYALLLGFTIGFVDALPIFGSGAVLWPWAVGSLIMGNYSFAIGLLVIYGAIFLTRQFLEPKVLSVQIGIHPLLTLGSIYAGMKLFGGIGLVAGPVILVTAKIILGAPDAVVIAEPEKISAEL